MDDSKISIFHSLVFHYCIKYNNTPLVVKGDESEGWIGVGCFVDEVERWLLVSKG